MSDTNDSNFIQVSIKKAGGFNLISKEEFLNISLEDRIKLISNGDIQFLVDGDPLPLREGLKKLKDS